MFEYLLGMMRQGRSHTDLSRDVVKGLARYEGLMDVMQHVNASVRPSNVVLDELERHVLPRVDSGLGYYADPYPRYDPQPANMLSLQNERNDRAIIEHVMTERVVDVNKVLAWMAEMGNRHDLKERCDMARIGEMAGKILVAAREDPALTGHVIQTECFPYLRKLMPDSFDHPEKALKRSIAKTLLAGVAQESTAYNHVVACTRSSTAITGSIIDKLVAPGSRVVLTAPYFEPFPVMLEGAGAKVLPVDTVKTGFKLKAEDLAKLVEEKHLGKGDWLLMASPNNANMEPYTQRELEALAQVIAQSGIRVICDELYARMGAEPHQSLASMVGHNKQGRQVDLREQVITVTGCSKQYPFVKEEKRKLGAAYFHNEDEARIVEDSLHRGSCDVSPAKAVEFRHLIQEMPGRLRAASSKQADARLKELKDIVGRVNDRYAPQFGGEKPIKLHCSDGAYMACLEFSKGMCERTGVKSSEDLQDYLFMTSWQYFRGLQSEGVKEPMVRMNVNNVHEQSRIFEERLDELVNHAAHNRAPQMAEVRQSVNKAIAASVRNERDKVSMATRQ